MFGFSQLCRYISLVVDSKSPSPPFHIHPLIFNHLANALRRPRFLDSRNIKKVCVCHSILSFTVLLSHGHLYMHDIACCEAAYANATHQHTCFRLPLHFTLRGHVCPTRRYRDARHIRAHQARPGVA